MPFIDSLALNNAAVAVCSDASTCAFPFPGICAAMMALTAASEASTTSVADAIREDVTANAASIVSNHQQYHSHFSSSSPCPSPSLALARHLFPLSLSLLLLFALVASRASRYIYCVYILLIAKAWLCRAARECTCCSPFALPLSKRDFGLSCSEQSLARDDNCIFIVRRVESIRGVIISKGEEVLGSIWTTFRFFKSLYKRRLDKDI